MGRQTTASSAAIHALHSFEPRPARGHDNRLRPRTDAHSAVTRGAVALTALVPEGRYEFRSNNSGVAQAWCALSTSLWDPETQPGGDNRGGGRLLRVNAVVAQGARLSVEDTALTAITANRAEVPSGR